ncbi:MAG: cation diffusion facilitator family transporter, partial [Bacteroidota bacterium]
LNGLITITGTVGGILSGSLALISDAIHNLSDTFALLLAFIADKVGKRKPNEKLTFGYKRFEILAAFINASLLTAISIYLIYAAIMRMMQPTEVHSSLMLIIAIIGLVGNLVSMIFLQKVAKISLNLRAAYLHLLGDTMSSVAVIAGALLIKFLHFLWIDPFLTLIICLVILWQAYRILRESVEILMQSTPGSLDLDEVRKLLESIPMIRNVHHVHCWQMQDHDILFEAHLEISRDITLGESKAILANAEKMLMEHFGITHTTFQLEYGFCDDASMIMHKMKR